MGAEGEWGCAFKDAIRSMQCAVYNAQYVILSALILSALILSAFTPASHTLAVELGEELSFCRNPTLARPQRSIAGGGVASPEAAKWRQCRGHRRRGGGGYLVCGVWCIVHGV
jgi:hypothetical protein